MQLEDEMGVANGGESKGRDHASLFDESAGKPMPEHERVVFSRLRHDEPVQLDELIEGLEAELGSAEIFTALFELELAGRVKQLPGKNYVRCF
jgi:DNA processing protein